MAAWGRHRTLRTGQGPKIFALNLPFRASSFKTGAMKLALVSTTRVRKVGGPSSSFFGGFFLALLSWFFPLFVLVGSVGIASFTLGLPPPFTLLRFGLVA